MILARKKQSFFLLFLLMSYMQLQAGLADCVSGIAVSMSAGLGLNAFKQHKRSKQLFEFCKKLKARQESMEEVANSNNKEIEKHFENTQQYLNDLSAYTQQELAKIYSLIKRQGSAGKKSIVVDGEQSLASLLAPQTSAALMVKPEVESSLSINDVVVNQDAWPEVKRLEEMIKHPEKFKSVGGKVPVGFLLYGHPGTGKTSLAYALKNSVKCNFYDVDFTAFVGKFPGEDASKLKKLIATAYKTAKETGKQSIVLLDGLEYLFNRKYSPPGEEVVSQLDVELAQLSQQSGEVIIVATTNNIKNLPSSFLRVDKFGYKVFLDLPDVQAREKILTKELKKYKVDASVVAASLATEFVGISGAELAFICNFAALQAAEQKSKKINSTHLKAAWVELLRQNADNQSAIKANDNPLNAGNFNRKYDVKAQFYPAGTVKTRLADVALDPSIKSEAMDFLEFLSCPDSFKEVGARIPSGILLHGPTGTGKTLLAKALAGEAGCSFFSAAASELTSKFLGESSGNIRKLFEAIRAEAAVSGKQVLLFIDEVDAFAKKRGSSYGSLHDDNAQMLNQFLCELDGFSTEPGKVIVIAATNRYDVLDDALLRPGRFDRKVEFEYPDKLIREEILLTHGKKYKFSKGLQLKDYAGMLLGCSGADIASILNEAAILAVKKSCKVIADAHLHEAADKVRFGISKASMIVTPEQLQRVAYHESGHAMIAILCKDCVPLKKVTILPRGASLGMTVFDVGKNDDAMLEFKENIYYRMMASLGGYCAESVMTGTTSGGVGGDLRSAKKYAAAMVCDYGMSSLGAVYVKKDANGNWPDDVRHEIDKLVRQAEEECFSILRANKHLIEKLSAALLEKETVYGHEVYKLLGIEDPRV